MHRHVALSPVPRLAEVDLAVMQERGLLRRVWQRQALRIHHRMPVDPSLSLLVLGGAKVAHDGVVKERVPHAQRSKCQ